MGSWDLARSTLAVTLGRGLRAVAKRRGGGSAVPGHVALVIQPDFLRRAVRDLPYGVIFVSGSNGKSTTTHFFTAILRAHGLKVFTNSSGGNVPRGIASALLPDVDARGRLAVDIAVLEVDEAYGPHLLEHLHPRGVLLVNVQVDQLNRFFDPNRVVGLLETIARACRDFVVLNADDDSLRALGGRLDQPVSWFGVESALVERSPNGLANFEQLDGAAEPIPGSARVTQVLELNDAAARIRFSVANAAASDAGLDTAADAGVWAAAGADAAGAPTAADVTEEVPLPVRGLHYAVDAAAAAAAAVQVLGPRFRPALVRESLAQAKTVYGRGEILEHRGEELEMIMMKNPPSLQVNLDALTAIPEQVFLAVDEGTPDPSWIFGSDLSMIDHVDVVAGTKAWQLALRLGYGNIRVGTVVPDTPSALDRFLQLPRPANGRKLLIVNYEEMMVIRRKLGASGIEGKANS